MADEHIDILAEDLTLVRTCLKSEAHKNGWLHPTVHIWFYTDSGEILIQKRAEDKKSFPDLWDVSVAGHIGAGEEVIIAAIRETKEEIGISVRREELSKIGVFKENFRHREDYIDNEMHHIYLCKLTKDLQALKIQKEELSALQLISINTFETAINQSGFEKTYVPHYPDYYSFILKKIREELNE